MDKSNEHCIPGIRQTSQDEILRAMESSTAIETGQRISAIEASLRGSGSNPPMGHLADTPQCNLIGQTYDWGCDQCMERKIVALRSPDRRTSLKLQLATFDRMEKKLSEEVKTFAG